MNAPIRVLLGVNLLATPAPDLRLHGRAVRGPKVRGAATARGHRGQAQLRARRRHAAARGGGLGTAQTPASLLVDTSIPFPVALDDGGWQKAGVPQSSLRSVPNQGSLRQGIVPLLRLGAFDVPSVPGLVGNEPVKEREAGLGIELDGLVGSGLFASFRVTLVDGGRTMWLEDFPARR